MSDQGLIKPAFRPACLLVGIAWLVDGVLISKKTASISMSNIST
ncbi:hypothetical protein PO124_02780 [Bacillus licheniformis]|nr:hypothetical protein [Bacillus licheniformis]